MSLLLEVADSAKGTSGPKKTLYRDLVIGMSYLKEMAPWEPSRVQSSAGPQQDLRSACSALSQLISLQAGGQRTQVVEARGMVLKEGSRAKHWRRELASAEHPWYPGTVLRSIRRFSLMATLWGRAVRPTLGETQVQRGEGTWCNQASRRWSRHLLLAPSDCKAHILCLELYLTAPFLTLPGIHRALFMWPQLCLGLSGTVDDWLSSFFRWRPSWIRCVTRVEPRLALDVWCQG